jgi:hypothetical protein
LKICKIWLLNTHFSKERNKVKFEKNLSKQRAQILRNLAKIYIFLFDNQNSPDGRKFRSRNELRQYLEKHNLDYPAEDFDFSIWGRGNRPSSKNSSNV